jgi:hypothetical protein
MTSAVEALVPVEDDGRETHLGQMEGDQCPGNAAPDHDHVAIGVGIERWIGPVPQRLQRGTQRQGPSIDDPCWNEHYRSVLIPCDGR